MVVASDEDVDEQRKEGSSIGRSEVGERRYHSEEGELIPFAPLYFPTVSCCPLTRLLYFHARSPVEDVRLILPLSSRLNLPSPLHLPTFLLSLNRSTSLPHLHLHQSYPPPPRRRPARCKASTLHIVIL
jgi:hypothetical protein